MHPHNIQIGKIYINNGKGRTRRRVLAIDARKALTSTPAASLPTAAAGSAA